MTLRPPASSGTHGDACASEAVGDGLCVDPELGAHVGQRQPGRVHFGGFCEGVVVPGALFAMAGDLAAVEVGGDGCAVDANISRELTDARAPSVGLNGVVDVGRGEASLGRV
jgi:hypothetical protein